MMKTTDLSLLTALDALLAEGSVTAAARRLGLSVSAMSRTLTRLRASTGDPLLVRAGRKLELTPHAAALRDRVHSVTNEAIAVLGTARSRLDIASLDATFSIRAGESFMEMLSSAVVAAVTKGAPNVRLRFMPKHDRDPYSLRKGLIDLEIGRRMTAGPEVHTQFLFRDRYVGVARIGHPLFARAQLTSRGLAAFGHVVSSRLLDEIQVERDVRVVVPGFPDAMRVAAQSDLIAILPQSSLGNALVKRQTPVPGIRSFDLPARLPDFPVSAMWHPRVDADPGQRWFRQQVIAVCRRAYPG